MEAKKIEKILSVSENNSDEKHLRETIMRTHTGRWPMWRAVRLKVVDGRILEIAQLVRSNGSPPFYVLRWSTKPIALVMIPCRSLRSAARTFRLEAAAPPLRS